MPCSRSRMDRRAVDADLSGSCRAFVWDWSLTSLPPDDMYLTPDCDLASLCSDRALGGSCLQIIVLDPMREFSRHIEGPPEPCGSDIIRVSTLRPLSALLAASAPDDVLVARVPSDGDGIEIAACIHDSRFPGSTFLVVDHPDQLGLHERLGLPRAEAIELTRVAALVRKLSTRGMASQASTATAPGRRERATFHGLVGRS